MMMSVDDRRTGHQRPQDRMTAYRFNRLRPASEGEMSMDEMSDSEKQAEVERLRAFDIPEATLEALKELADITDVEGQDRLASLMVDALRTYEWIVFQQAHSRTVVALEQAEVELLERAPEVSGTRESLTTFVPPDKQQRALEYFTRATLNAASQAPAAGERIEKQSRCSVMFNSERIQGQCSYAALPGNDMCAGHDSQRITSTSEPPSAPQTIHVSSTQGFEPGGMVRINETTYRVLAVDHVAKVLTIREPPAATTETPTPTDAVNTGIQRRVRPYTVTYVDTVLAEGVPDRSYECDAPRVGRRPSDRLPDED